MRVINSRDNPLIKHARAVRDRKERAFIFVEGVRLCEEAARAALEIEHVLYTEKLLQEARGRALLEALELRGTPSALVNEQVLSSISDTKTPQGIILLARTPPTGSQLLTPRDSLNPLLLIMHRINNPANAGAILRTAEAAGATGAITTAGSTDIFSPKALRGAMGSGFRLPLWTRASFDEVLSWCAAQKIRTLCADAQGPRSYADVDWTGPRALIVGPEASGLSAEEVAAADEAVKIPMRGEVESLNVAVASAIILYEAARQRAHRPNTGN